MPRSTCARHPRCGSVTVYDTTIEESPCSEPLAEPEERDPRRRARRRGGPPTSAIARAGGGALSLLRRKPRPVSAAQASGNGRDAARAAPVAPVAVAGATPPIVMGDENRIRQVVANLLGNARRFTAEDSPIDLRLGVDACGGMGWIEVADHGEGIPEQIRDKIFQRFWRADTSRARETGGTGLGLSIVASIVEALHGSGHCDRDARRRRDIPRRVPAGAGSATPRSTCMIETQPLERAAAGLSGGSSPVAGRAVRAHTDRSGTAARAMRIGS